MPSLRNCIDIVSTALYVLSTLTHLTCRLRCVYRLLIRSAQLLCCVFCFYVFVLSLRKLFNKTKIYSYVYFVRVLSRRKLVLLFNFYVYDWFACVLSLRKLWYMDSSLLWIKDKLLLRVHSEPSRCQQRYFYMNGRRPRGGRRSAWPSWPGRRRARSSVIY
jgi:hypothetical protein